MARPPTEIGTWGKITTKKIHAGVWQAFCRVRDDDGGLRAIKRTGPTSTAAETALKKALATRPSVLIAASEITRDSLVKDVCETWFEEEIENSNKSPGTKRAYRERLDNQVIPMLGKHRVYECTVGRLDRFIGGVEKKHGPSVAKLTRTVLGGVMGFATRRDAAPSNLVRDIHRIESEVKQSRTLEAEEAIALRQQIRSNEKAQARDIPEFTDFMLATGARCGEAAAVTWDCLNLGPEDDDDFEATVEIRGTVVRVKGVGLIIKGPKNGEEGYRTLELPHWQVVALRARRRRMAAINLALVAPDAPVFPAPRGGLRDPSNTQADLREVFDLPDEHGNPTTEWTWVTSHVWRRTLSTLMEAAGYTARQAADQLGHARVSMTQDRYFGRGKKKTGAKQVMERLIT